MDVMPLDAIQNQSIGAEIGDVDVRDLSDGDFQTVREALYTHGVIVFRDQTLTPEDQLAFARRWGEINVNRFFPTVDGYPEVAQVRKEPDDLGVIGGNWHTDHSYDQVPALGSVLYSLETPSTGGDTLFANMYAAYDALSDGLKETLGSLNAIHSSRHVFGMASPRMRNADQATQDSVHPVVIRHPDSGRRALYVNGEFTTQIEGWTVAESRPLLDYLSQFGHSPEFTCRLRWRPGSLAVWDNRCTWHRALNDYPGEHRLMHRVTIEGVPLERA
jgi:taurine dioxygenase